jgi:hypothetical protein
VRTTVDIPDPLDRELKGKAAGEGRAIKELILRGVNKNWGVSSPEHGCKTLDSDARICCCRCTQVSLRRLLKTPAVMGAEVMSQIEASYDLWREDAHPLSRISRRTAECRSLPFAISFGNDVRSRFLG